MKAFKVQTILILVLSFVLFGCKSEEIKQNFNNRKQLFNHDWKFNLSNDAEFSDPEYNDANWRTLDLPQDWSIEGTPEINNPSGILVGRTTKTYGVLFVVAFTSSGLWA